MAIRTTLDVGKVYMGHNAVCKVFNPFGNEAVLCRMKDLTIENSTETEDVTTFPSKTRVYMATTDDVKISGTTYYVNPIVKKSFDEKTVIHIQVFLDGDEVKPYLDTKVVATKFDEKISTDSVVEYDVEFVSAEEAQVVIWTQEQAEAQNIPEEEPVVAPEEPVEEPVEETVEETTEEVTEEKSTK